MDSNPLARVSIVAYKPKPGKQAELIELTREHVPYLRRIGLATERANIIATADDGTVIEVFEWVEGGIEKAHTHAELGKLWGRYAALCDFVPLKTLNEAGMMFANFVPVD